MKGESSSLRQAIEERIWRIDEIQNRLQNVRDDCSRSEISALLRQLLSEAKGLQLQLLKLEKDGEINTSEEQQQMCHLFVKQLSGILGYRITGNGTSDEPEKETSRLEDNMKSIKSEYKQVCGTDSDSDVEFGQTVTPDAKVRILYLTCLQILVKYSPKAFHPEWKYLLSAEIITRDSHSLGELPVVTLIHAIAREPHPKARHAAAASLSTLFEGPAQRAYLNIAESLNENKVRGFVSLSQSMGTLVASSIETMNQCVTYENDKSTCCAIVRGLTTILSGVSWKRMNLRLLGHSISALCDRVEKCLKNKPEVVGISQACIHALALLFGLKFGNSQDLTDAIQHLVLPEGERNRLMPILVICSDHPSDLIRHDTYSALRGLLRLFPNYMASYNWNIWHTCATLETNLLKMDLNRAARGVFEQTSQQMILFLGDILSLIDMPGSQAEDNGPDAYDIIVKMFLSASKNQSEKIRSAAYCSIALLPSAYWQHRPGNASQIIIENICHASVNDPESTVRSNSMRCLNYITKCLLPGDFGTEDKLLIVIRKGIQDAVLAVRIQCSSLLLQMSENLWHQAMENIMQWRSNHDTVSSYWNQLVRSCQVACQDHDKVKSGAIKSLGFLVGVAIRVSPDTVWLEDESVSSMLDVLTQSLGSRTLSAQWAACESIKVVFLTFRLTCGSLDHFNGNLDPISCLRVTLKEIIQHCTNSRTYMLAEDCLEQLSQDSWNA
eukprot:jgi/Picsp_1/2601/NSC_00832-R1_heat repeat-containing protein 6